MTTQILDGKATAAAITYEPTERTVAVAAHPCSGDIGGASGRPGPVTVDMTTPGEVVVDVGTTPMTRAMLLVNVVERAEALLAAGRTTGS